MALVIKTNNQVREVRDAWDSTPEMREEFDYIDWDAGNDSTSFVKYKGEWYDLGDMEPITGGELREKGYTQMQTQTMWSGVAFKWVEHNNEWGVIPAYFYYTDWTTDRWSIIGPSKKGIKSQ